MRNEYCTWAVTNRLVKNINYIPWYFDFLSWDINIDQYKTSISIVHSHFYQYVVACDQIFLSNQLLDLHLSQELFLLLQNGLHQHLSLLFLEQECHLSKKKKTQNNPLIAFTLQIHLIIYGSWIYNYQCNQCISSLKLWVRTPFMTKCTRNNIMW